MRTYIKTTLIMLLTCLPFQASHADEYSDALSVFQKAGESGAYFDSAYGYAIFPTIGKGGIGIGGAHGKGKVDSQVTAIGKTSMTQLTIGLQLGGQAYSQIIFFETAEALMQFTSGNFEFSAQATAVAITAGVSADASTTGGLAAGASGGRNDATTAHGGYRRGLAVFTIARGGLMFEAVLGGQKFKFTPLAQVQ